MTLTEEWRAVIGYEGLYEVSNLGRVRSLRIRGGQYDRARKIPLVRALRLRDGYPTMDLPGPERKRRTEITINVHRLVCEAFHGPQPDGFECAHLNGNRADIRADNLKWASPIENQSHRILHGTDCRGSKQYSAILSEKDVLTIRRNYTGERGQLTQWSQEFGCTISTISAALHGKNWKHING